MDRDEPISTRQKTGGVMQKQWFYLVALALAACAVAPSAPDAAAQAAQTSAAPRSAVEFTSLARGAYSTLRFERMQAITDNETLTAVWQQMSADASPAVDFASDMVVLIASGEHRSGGYSVVVTGVEQDGANLYVQVQLRSPGDACVVSAVLTQPYHLITLARSDLPVQFEIGHEVIDCGVE